MRKEDVQSKLDIIPENLEKLEILRAMGYEKFTSDFRNIDSALHRFQTSIQALVDIGGYIIASLGLRTPGTSGEVIDILVENGLVRKYLLPMPGTDTKRTGKLKFEGLPPCNSYFCRLQSTQ